jgi:hypothetical protein
MLTMRNEWSVEDLLNARAEVRRLRKLMIDRRAQLRQTKLDLAAATDRLEDHLTELEQHQGRLPFAEVDAEAPAPAPRAHANGRRQRAPDLGPAPKAPQSNWQETR